MQFIDRFKSDVKSSEGRETLRFALRLFLLLLAYYLLKPVREELILEGGSAEIRSYALAAEAALLLLLVPFYSRLIHKLHGERLFVWVTLFLAANIFLFYLAGSFGLDIGVLFFIWLGLFSVVQISQFWTMVSDYHSVEKGKYLTSYIAMGGSLGAIVGSMMAKSTFLLIGIYGLMLLTIAMLLLSVLIPAANATAIHISKHEKKESIGHLLGGLHRVIELPYLRWIAASVVLLNLINSTGEFILADFVTAEKSGSEIGVFYATFFLYINIATLLLQAFIVRPLYRLVGVGGALVCLALINMSMYVSVLAFPVLAWFTIVKVADNSIDYSVANTTKQILFLPLDRYTRYEGMQTINTFFTRFGDLIQGGLIYLVIHLMGLSTIYLVGMNVGLCMVWLLVTLRVKNNFNDLLNRTASSGLNVERGDKR
ncbi:MAG: hypothetical protein R8K49_08440 [Mariprofundaceae bacterium]